MLVALGGILGGYNGSFDFKKPGDPFPAEVPFVFMRTVMDFNEATIALKPGF